MKTHELVGLREIKDPREIKKGMVLLTVDMEDLKV